MPTGPTKAGALQFRFEQRKDVAIEALEADRDVSRFAEQRGHVRRNAAVRSWPPPSWPGTVLCGH